MFLFLLLRTTNIKEQNIYAFAKKNSSYLTVDTVTLWRASGLHDDTSNASCLDGELLQVLIISNIGRNSVTDDIRRLLAIRLLPLRIKLLVGLGDFLLRRLLADKQR